MISKDLLLKSIHEKIVNLKKSPLYSFRVKNNYQVVSGEGSPEAKIVFIGEAPGKEEAKTGRPFIGRSGKLLRQLINETGLSENEVFITSPVKYLPEYVTPTPEDVAHGRVHLMEQFKIIEPKVVVLLGRVAALAVLEKDISVAKERGTVVEKDGLKYLMTYHPAAPLYSPKVKAELLKDFEKLKTLISLKT
jgi:DNA polymerase